MKDQYLGDSKDSFKWDYHDYLTRELGYSTLKLALMRTKDDGTCHGNSPPEDYPAREEVLALCGELQQKCEQEKRDLSLLCHLPLKTGAAYSVHLHNGDRYFAVASRWGYFEGFCGGRSQVVFVDPDIGFEPPKSSYDERHVQFCEINRIVEQVSKESVVSIFQFSRRGQKKEEFKKRHESIRERLCGFTTAIYWDVKVMFVLLSQSQELIRRIYNINHCYRRMVLSRRSGFEDKLQLCACKELSFQGVRQGQNAASDRSGW